MTLQVWKVIFKEWRGQSYWILANGWKQALARAEALRRIEEKDSEMSLHIDTLEFDGTIDYPKSLSPRRKTK